MSRDYLIRLRDMLDDASADQVPLIAWQRQLLEVRMPFATAAATCDGPMGRNPALARSRGGRADTILAG